MNNHNTSIGYVGTVTIEFPHKRVITHNNGTKTFFNLLNRFIARQTITINELPAFLMLYATDSATLLANPSALDNKPLTILNRPIGIISSVVTNTDGKEVILLTTPLDGSYLNSSLNTEDLAGVSVAVLSSDAKHILAASTIDDGAGLINSLMTGSNATVKWQMSFDNE
jgi:hypothetical protein